MSICSAALWQRQIRMLQIAAAGSMGAEKKTQFTSAVCHPVGGNNFTSAVAMALLAVICTTLWPKKYVTSKKNTKTTINL